MTPLLWFLAGCSVAAVACFFYIRWTITACEKVIDDYRKMSDAWKEACDKWRQLATRDDADWWKN